MSIRKITLVASLLALVAGFDAFAQTPERTEEQKKQDKTLYENIQKEVERMTESLKLEDWQEFYIDSIYTHDYQAMQQEFEELQAKKVTNTDMYYDIRYKWQDKMYEATQKVLNEDQWKKYLKQGAARDKKARDKRRANAGKK